MISGISSKERVLSTILHQPVDHLPICFNSICHGGVAFIDQLFPDPFKKAKYYMELGVDTGVNLNLAEFNQHMGLTNFTSHENISVKQWNENVKGEECAISIKEFETAKGKLRQSVRRRDEYPHSIIPLFSDFNVPPGRTYKYLIDKKEELDVLSCILKAPNRNELNRFFEFAAVAKDFCDKNNILFTATTLGVADIMIWLSGVENILFAAADEPEFLERYIQIVADWNMKVLEIYIDAGVDLVTRRGWYECTDFWSPKMYKEFLFAPLKKEIEVAHQADVKFSYIMNSGATALKDHFIDLGLDILTNIEPDKNNLVLMKKAIDKSIVLCTGVNNYNVIELGTEAEVQKAVIEAIETLSPNGGFILAPSDSILSTSEIAKRNFYKMVDTWKEYASV